MKQTHLLEAGQAVVLSHRITRVLDFLPWVELLTIQQ